MNISLAQDKSGLGSIEEIKANCQTIVDHFANDASSEAFANLRNIWLLPEDELVFLEQKSIEQLNLIEGRYGKTIGNKLAKEEVIEDIVYKVTYVVKFEYHALRYQFIFYNGKDNKWYLNNFKWDDSISKLFED